MFYERKIRYLDYYRNGERVKNGGYAKTEVRDDSFRLEVSLKGISCADMDSADVLLHSEEREIVLGQINVKNGSGEFYYRGSMKSGIDGTGLMYSEVCGIRIPLDETTEISARWYPSDGKEKEEKNEKEELLAVEENREKREEKYTVKGKEKSVETLPEAVCLLEDKWFQLVSIYPHINPFRDEREYLSIGPADFVLFTADSYRTANNSFLLHGYYNYHHLILTRVEKRGEILYYVGVPGNYYDREKQVAVMFGFESFECAEEPAQKGDFGYYMMRVSL